MVGHVVCALCDYGGEIASCEGTCLRSFHATKDSGEDCATLGHSRQQFNAMNVFMCKNCEYERYQYFACGCLDSAKTDPPEAFPCASATCGYFYHSKCVAQLLFPENEAKSTEYTAKITNGAKFACPLHKCDICKYGENKEVKELQFAVCRRCPNPYHRRCLPRKIAFEDITESGQCVFQRAWEDLLPNNRILIYCLKHDIDPKYRTPTRHHIKFPEDPAAIKKPLNYVNGMNRKIVKIRRIDELPSAPLPGVKRSSGMVKHSSLGNLMNKRRKIPVSGERSAVMEQPLVMSELPFSSFPEIDRYTEMRIYEFPQKTSAAITMEDVQKMLVVPSSHAPHLQNTDKITMGKVVKAALHMMLENGACIEDARSVCSPSDLFQLAKRKNKLDIFLAAFLHGMRYTSYGRHFTKLDKLQLVVHFCCGSNDFSLLMKEKLEAFGKKCFFKSYDLIQPKVRGCFAVLERAFVLNAKPFMSQDPGNNVRQPPAELSTAAVFVCACGHEISMSPNLKTTTVFELVQAALKKRKIKVQDSYFTINGRPLNGDQILNDIPLYQDSRIHVKPRTRGGMLFPIYSNPMMCDRLNNILIGNAPGKFEAVRLPLELRSPGQGHPYVYFLGTFSQYIIHNLFIFVFRDGHHRQQRCWQGSFRTEDILYSTGGDVLIDPSVPWVQYYPEGAAADRMQLYNIIDTYLRPPWLGNAVHVDFLLNLLQNDDEDLWSNRDFITFVINHPSLLSFADKHKWYDLIDQMLLQLTQNELAALRELFNNPLWSGWSDYVRNVPGIMHTYMYNARYDLERQNSVSLYTQHVDQAFHLGRNFLKHPPHGVSLQVAEAAFSYLMDHLLCVFVLVVLMDFQAPPGWNLIAIISNSNSDKSALE